MKLTARQTSVNYFESVNLFPFFIKRTMKHETMAKTGSKSFCSMLLKGEVLCTACEGFFGGAFCS